MTIGGKPAEEWGEDHAAEPDAFAAADVRHDAWALLDQDYGDPVDAQDEKALPARSQYGDKLPAFLLTLVAGSLG